ncbi:hypothetical protein GC097_24850 [Paenibacillus sp. LMG 31457]|uniref:Photosynthesis system II assembly factor Ycf48/Hcf136-like domain-containing protein n=1 Tax=Paenibacillus planticolens TaxID=2654976 RepID=A0ABX1ZT50_9BACL|nr:hypothetical protein [Paenibacillus planticolens]
MMNNKKLVILIIFVLCAGCFHEKAPTPSPHITRSTVKEKRNAVLSMVQGDNIQVQDESAPKRNIPTKGITFVDELHGYGFTSGNGETTLMQTGDGGITWKVQKGLAPLTAPSSLSFLDYRTGWVLTKETNGQKSELRLTADGGQTWEVIAQDLPGLEGKNEVAFFRFFNRQTGLIAVRSDKDLILIRTQDGGITWLASNRIPMPGAGVITFLSSKEGWFMGAGASSSSGSNEKGKETVVLYHMTDGGTWEEAGKIATSLMPQALTFADASHGFALLQSNRQNPEQEQGRQLLRTSDGGKTWSQHTFPTAFQPLDASLQLSFLTSSSGWLWDARNVWKTKDGGLNWKLLLPQAVK